MLTENPGLGETKKLFVLCRMAGYMGNDWPPGVKQYNYVQQVSQFLAGGNTIRRLVQHFWQILNDAVFLATNFCRQNDFLNGELHIILKL